MMMTRMSGDGLVLKEAAVNHGHSGCRLKEGQSTFKLWYVAPISKVVILYGYDHTLDGPSDDDDDLDGLEDDDLDGL